MSLFPIWFTLVIASSQPPHQEPAETPAVRELKPGDAPAKGSLADVGWLAGRWVGGGLGGTCDETWSPALGGCMVGTFRYLQNDKLVFSEFFMLAEDQGSLTLKLKHFNPSLEGWEEKNAHVAFQLVKLEPGIAWFNGITYRRLGESGLIVDVAIRNKQTGKAAIERFTFHRAKD